ncbi:hypothetical protein AC629_42445 [Bradyrhizobium sp. NAS80.1]|uniref:hypothetical protein n=1 Tax=Bradyrhizobium sp. NAS80.1 TaxID=1680159 RepID=UPI00095EFCE7|nr:hypothetical protein [Bradyrhizobium sp. NAS80.1]OKO67881.1 hypothetical protein AC629_42445 [Bradyrhizobium sp. NAS80.1]
MTDDNNHLKVINNALGRIGAGKIMAEDEDTELAGQVVPVYYSRLKAVLAMHEWSFAGKTYKLDAVAKTAENDYDAAAQIFNNGWRFAFELPSPRLGLPRKVLRDPRNPRDPLREFLIESGWLYADRDAVWAVVTVMPDPQVWDPQFTLAIEQIAAADFAIPVTHDAALDAKIRVIAEGTPEEQGRGGLIGRAMASDAAKSRTATAQWHDPLTDARLS